MTRPTHSDLNRNNVYQSLGHYDESGLLPDWMIREQVKIEPFAECQSRPGLISYGVSSYGYDMRVGYKFKVFTPARCAVVDPKNFSSDAFVDIDLTPVPHQLKPYQSLTTGLPQINTWRCVVCDKVGSENFRDGQCGVKKPDHVLIPPNSFALGESVEAFTIPRDILCVVLGKSTYARCGIVVNCTPGEPEWNGKYTVEISNTGPLPAKIYAGEGIAQVLFFRTAAVCQVSYADKKGRYQAQAGLTLPFVDGKP